MGTTFSQKTASIWKKYPSWLIAAIVLSSIPAVETIFTWDIDGIITKNNYLLRHWSLLVLIVELSVILLLRRVRTVPTIEYKPTKLVLMLSATGFAFAFLSNILHSERYFDSFFILFRYIIHGLLCWRILVAWPSDCRSTSEIWLAIISMGAALYAGLLIVFAISVPNWNDFDWIGRMPSGTNIRQIGDKLALLAIAPLILVIFRTGKWRTAAFAVVILTIGFVAWSGTRAGLLGVASGCLLATVLAWRGLPKMGVIYGAMALCLGTAASLFFKVPSVAFGLIRIVEASRGGDVSAGRTDIWLYAIGKIQENPWIGYGSGMFRKYLETDLGLAYNHPHNLILQFAFDWGVIATACFLTLWAILGWAIATAHNATPMHKFAALAGYGAISAIGMIDGVFYYPLPMVTAIMLILPILSERILENRTRTADTNSIASTDRNLKI